MIIFFLITIDSTQAYAKNNSLIDKDTGYARIFIYNSIDQKTSKPIKRMNISGSASSAMFLDSNELVYDYAKFYYIASHFSPTLKNSLMLGGAAYTFPQDFLNKYPEANLDVVEIDPGVTDLAYQYFGLKDNPRLNIIHEDARTFLNKNEKKYDVIFGDAFSSRHSVPYQLTTKEATQKIYNSLNDEGVIINNIISSLEGEKSSFLKAEYKTYKSIFPQVYLFPVSRPEDTENIQNIILVAIKSTQDKSLKSDNETIDNYLKNLYTGNIPDDLPILTDDYAPVDYYINETI